MRRKLRSPTRTFYALYTYRPELKLGEKNSIRYKMATSLDANGHFKLYSKWRQSLPVGGSGGSSPGAESQNLSSARVQGVETVDGLFLFGNNLLALLQIAGRDF